MPGSRISVEILGSSSELQAAVAKASESLKGLGSVLSKQTDLSLAAGDKTVRMNAAVAESYKRAALTATSTARQTAVSYSRSAGEQTAASERVTRAMEAQARAAKVTAEQQVRANDLAAASAARTAARQEASAAKTRAAFGAQNSELTRMGRTLSAGLLGAAAASTYLAVKFQSNTTRLQTQAGATVKQVDKLRKGILDMASQVGFVPNQLADGMYHVVSSMNAVLPAATRVKEELQIMKVAAEGAQVGHSNLEDTTYALASAMNALHQRGSDASKTMGQLNAIVGAGDMTMTDLLKALESGLIPAARTFHISLQSVGSALAVMGDMGMRGALAGTRLRMSLALLGAPSAKAAGYLEAIGMSSKQALASTARMSKTLEAAGLSVTTLSNDLKRPNGIAFALHDLDKHLQASGLSANAAAALISRAFGGGRSGAAIQLLAQNTDRLNVKFKQIGDGAAGFGKAWAATQQTLAFQLKQTEATAVSLATKLGTYLLPVVHSILGDLKDLVHWFEQNHAAVVALEGVLATFAAVTIGSFFVSQLHKAIALAKELKSALMLEGLGSGAPMAVGAAALPAGTAVTGAAVTGAASTAVPQAEKYDRTLAQGILGPIKGLAARALRGAVIGGLGVLVSQAVGGAIHGGVGQAISKIGTDTAIGAGFGSIFGPAGIAGGALIGGLVGSIDFFVNKDATKYGNDIADKLTAPLAPALRKQFHNGIASALNDAHKLQPFLPGKGQIPYAAPSAKPGAPHVTRGGAVVVDPRISAEQMQQFQEAGRKAAEATIAGLKSVKFPTQGLLMTDMIGQLRKLPAQARPEAAKVMLQYADGLAQQGKMPRRAVDAMIASIEHAFPGLQSYLMTQGIASDRQLASALKFNTASNQLKQTLANYRQQFGDWSISTKITGQNIDSNIATAMTHMRDIVRTTTGQTHRQAVAELKQLQQQVNQLFTTMADQVAARAGDMKKAVADGSLQAYQIGATNWSRFAKAIASAVASGVLSTEQGMKQITQALNNALKALGEKPLSLTQVQGLSPAILQGLASGQLSSGAVASPHAGGGFIGSPGEKGRDRVPIVVGRGEAVLNHSQQQVVNGALMRAGIGGLPEVFSKVTRPHFMAQGGYASGGQVNAATGVGGSGTVNQGQSYVFPFPKGEAFSWQRVDQGQDLQGPPGGPVLAIAPGIVSQASDRFGGFGPFYPTEQITSGSLAGRGVYYGHTKIVKTGAVSPGDVIAYTQPRANDWTAAPAGWLELGFLPYGSMSAGNAIAPILHALAAGHQVAGFGGGLGGLAAPAWKTLTAPTVKGTGAIATLVRAVMRKATGAANRFGQSKAGALGGTSGGSTAGLAGNEMQIVNQLAARFGWTSQVQDWANVLRAESNGSLTDTNPSSGAYGLAQFINGPSDYFKYGGNPTTYAGQLLAMANYIKQRYGNPAAAWAHEQANHWYSRGGIVGNVARMAQGGTVVQGRVSWFNDHATASGIPADTTAGLSLRIPGTSYGDASNRALLHHMFRLVIGGHSGTFPDIDLGPNESTGRSIDVSAPAVSAMGFTTGNFPTDATGTATMVGAGGASSSAPSRARKLPKLKPIKLRVPFKTPPKLANMPVLNKAFSALDGILNQSTGSVAKFADLIQISQRVNSQTDNEYATAHPGLDIATGLLTPAGGGAASVDQVFVGQRLAQLQQTYAWEAQIKAQLQRAVKIVDGLVKRLYEEIVKRQQEVAAIQLRIGANAGAADELERSEHATKDPRTKAALKREVAAIRDLNKRLGGDSRKVGKGGLIGTIGGELTGLRERLTTLMDDRVQLVGPSGFGGSLGTATLDLQDDADALRVFSPGALAQALAAANQSTTGTDNSLLNSLLQQENLQLSQANALNQAQTRALLSMIPEIPAYKDGGPVLRDTLAMVHGGEHVVPEGGALVLREGRGATAPDVHVHVHGDAQGLIRTIRSEIADPRNVRTVSRAIGQRTSMLAGAPGGFR